MGCCQTDIPVVMDFEDQISNLKTTEPRPMNKKQNLIDLMRNHNKKNS